MCESVNVLIVRSFVYVYFLNLHRWYHKSATFSTCFFCFSLFWDFYLSLPVEFYGYKAGMSKSQPPGPCGTQLCHLFTYCLWLLSGHSDDWIVTETTYTTSTNYLLSGPLQGKNADPWCRVFCCVSNHCISDSLAIELGWLYFFHGYSASRNDPLYLLMHTCNYLWSRYWQG